MPHKRDTPIDWANTVTETLTGNIALTYLYHSTDDGKWEIVKCNTNAIGNCSIPSAKDYQATSTSTTVSLPVTAIAGLAFYNCTKLTGITVPNSVTTIGHTAFQSCKKITYLTLPINSSFTEIAPKSISSCYDLKSLIIPQSVTTIGYRAFAGSGLTSIIIPSTVTTLGKKIINSPSSSSRLGGRCFYYCKDLTEIIFNETCQITEILPYMFSRCSALLTITIPSSVTTISKNVLLLTDALTEVVLETTNPAILRQYFVSGNLPTDAVITPPQNMITTIDNVIFNSSSTELWKSSFSVETTYTCPNTVTKICECAFQNSTNLVKIIIPNSVTHIGHRAFYNCSNLTEVEFNNANSNLEYIGIQAFARCIQLKLTNNDLPYKLKTIEAGAFELCQELEKIKMPNTVTFLGEKAFFSCGKTTELVISSGLTEIGHFTSHSQRSSFSVAGDTVLLQGNLWDGETLFANTDRIDNETFTYQWKRGTTEIGTDDTYTLVEADMNKSISVTVTYTLDNVSHEYITTKYVSGSTRITGAQWSFSGVFSSNGFSSITIPTNILKIGYKAFSGCSNLVEINWEGETAVTELGSYCFQSCGLTNIDIPNSVTKLGDHCFRNCKSLWNVALQPSYPNVSNLTAISSYCFKSCTSLKRIFIPYKIEKINQSAFQDSGLVILFSDPEAGTQTDAATAFQGDYLIPSSVTYIGKNAFSSSKLRAIVLPSTLSLIDENAFDGCFDLKFVLLNCQNTHPNAFGSSKYKYSSAPDGWMTAWMIDQSALSNIMRPLGGCPGIETVEFDESISNVKTWFTDCSMIQNIIVGKNVASVEDYAFEWLGAVLRDHILWLSVIDTPPLFGGIEFSSVTAVTLKGILKTTELNIATGGDDIRLWDVTGRFGGGGAHEIWGSTYSTMSIEENAIIYLIGTLTITTKLKIENGSALYITGGGILNIASTATVEIEPKGFLISQGTINNNGSMVRIEPTA